MTESRRIHYFSRFTTRDSVSIDGDTSIRGRILAVCFREDLITYQVTWFHNGCSYSEWIEEWRLLIWEE